MLFRFHRGGLMESMQTAKEVRDIAGICQLMNKTGFSLFCNIITPDMLSIRYYGYDQRVDWNTWIVLFNGAPVGFTNGNFE